MRDACTRQRLNEIDASEVRRCSEANLAPALQLVKQQLKEQLKGQRGLKGMKEEVVCARLLNDSESR